MANTLFSIIIPTYNRGNEIGRCLSSVINQTYYNWEAIVVDNYSSDNTEEIVKNLNDNRIRYYENHNYGIIAVSRNFGIERANGDWICFLDSDDSWLYNKLENLLPYVCTHDLIYHGFFKNGKSKSPIKRNEVLFYTVRKPEISYVLQRSDPFATSCSAVSKKFLGSTRFFL